MNYEVLCEILAQITKAQTSFKLEIIIKWEKSRTVLLNVDLGGYKLMTDMLGTKKMVER